MSKRATYSYPTPTVTYKCSEPGCEHSYGTRRANLAEIIAHREAAGHTADESE